MVGLVGWWVGGLADWWADDTFTLLRLFVGERVLQSNDCPGHGVFVRKEKDGMCTVRKKVV